MAKAVACPFTQLTSRIATETRFLLRPYCPNVIVQADNANLRRGFEQPHADLRSAGSIHQSGDRDRGAPAWSAAANSSSVARVYAQLERDGILETRRGVGTFVLESPSPQAARAHRERELREIIQRFVGDAAMLGFTLPELINQLRNEEKK
jgi:hypothetical protein